MTGEAPAGPPKSAATDDDSPTMAILADKYLDHAQTYYGEKSTELRNSKLALKPLVMLYGDKYASRFEPVKFRGCRDWWLGDTSLLHVCSRVSRSRTVQERR